MRTLHVEDFPEFKILTGIIIFFSAAFILTAVLGRRKWVNVLFVLFVLFGVIAMIDFWRWEYDYGHNLDPTAAIQVPGMSYQPPVIGHKKLLNFDAYSYPDTGGWIAVAVAGVFFLIWFLDWRKNRKIKMNKNYKGTTATVATLLAFFVLTGCNPKPEKIAIGKDACAECKMTIMDPKFGGEIVSKKGKVFKNRDG